MGGAPKELDFEQVKAIIPQRFPFMMLDCVKEIEPGKRVVGIKNLTGNEWFYQGHFPERAITPGAMISEAAAQTGIVFFHIANPPKERVTYLVGHSDLRFLKPVFPGDRMEIEVLPERLFEQGGLLKANIRVEGQLVSKGDFTLSAVKNVKR